MLRTKLLIFTLISLCNLLIAQNSNKFTTQYSNNNEIIIAINPLLHSNYGFAYPMTYSITIPSNSNQLRTYKKYNINQGWSLIQEKTSNDFFNGIEAVRYDYAVNKAIVSLTFSSSSDSIFIRITNQLGNIVPIEYSDICKYYDNRNAVVTTTADDWKKNTINDFNKAINIFRSRNLWLSGAIITDSSILMDTQSWQIIQKQLDSGYVEVLSHSRTHVHPPYNYQSEIVGSKNDILKNLDLPLLFRKFEKEYIYAYILPYGNYNDDIDYVAGSANYLVTRGVYQAVYDFTLWNNYNNIYERSNVAYEIGPLWNGVTDLVVLNQTFNLVLQNNKIYHFFIHPEILERYHLWGLLSEHLNYISNRKNIWYTSFGHLYLYHLLEDGDYILNPVELSSFSVSFNQNAVSLKWQTETEVDNYGFEVERRTFDNWVKIGFVQGSGNSNSPKSYIYVDKNLEGGSKFEYRLKQIDTEGKFEYSSLVKVEIIPNQYQLMQNYPNPANPTTKIKFTLPKETELKIVLYDMLGERMKTLAEGKYEAGFYDVELVGSDLPSGVYMYSLESTDFVNTKKLMLLK